MPRRVLKCRLDAKLANPALRKFDLNPELYITKHRQALVASALTILAGYLQSDAYRAGGAILGETTASFEDWDALCRQPVAWLAQSYEGIEDPGNALKEAAASDPQLEALATLLKAIEGAMGLEWWQTKDLVQASQTAYAQGTTYELRNARLDLKGCLDDFFPGRGVTNQGAGRVLANRVDRIAGGRVLVSRKESDRTFFRIENANNKNAHN